jgi:hypothetical protein
LFPYLQNKAKTEFVVFHLQYNFYNGNIEFPEYLIISVLNNKMYFVFPFCVVLLNINVNI